MAQEFTSRVAQARRTKSCKLLEALSQEYQLAAAKTKRSSAFVKLYGQTDPLEGSSCAVGPQSAALPAAPSSPGLPPAAVASDGSSDGPPVIRIQVGAPASTAPALSATPPGSPGVPPAGTPAAAGEFYSSAADVWAGGEVTRRACEIGQRGADGACRKFGFAIGSAQSAPLPSGNPAVNLGSHSGEGSGSVFAFDPGPSVDPQTADVAAAMGINGTLEDAYNAAATVAREAPKEEKKSSALPWILGGLAAWALLAGAKGRRRRAA